MNFELYVFDIKTAFLNAKLNEEVYMRQIPGYPESDPATVLRALRALYSIKQSGHKWFAELSGTCYYLIPP